MPKDWNALIKHESAGDTQYAELFTIPELSNIVRRKNNDIWYTVGIFENKLSALLTVFNNVIEITRIWVYPKYRHQGFMTSFVYRLHSVANKLNMDLNMGCITSKRMILIIHKNHKSWTQCHDDPTSYKFVGYIKKP